MNCTFLSSNMYISYQGVLPYKQKIIVHLLSVDMEMELLLGDPVSWQFKLKSQELTKKYLHENDGTTISKVLIMVQ